MKCICNNYLSEWWLEFEFDFPKARPVNLERVFFPILPKNERKISARLGQNLTFSSSFFGRIEDTNISFQDELTFSFEKT